MRVVGVVMMVVGLVAAMLATATACLAPMRLSPQTLTSLTLAEGAGVRAMDAIDRAALLARAREGAITPEDALRAIDARPPRFPAIGEDGRPASLGNAQLDELRQRDALRYLHVREFDFVRWPLWWAFVLGSTLLGVGARVVRDASRKSRAARADELGRAGASHAGRAGSFLPLQRVGAVRSSLERVRRAAASMDCPVERLAALDAGLADLVGAEVAGVHDAGRLIEAQIGPGAYAGIMETFGWAERAIGRARSGARDGQARAAEEALARAADALERTEEDLGLARMRLGR